MEQVQKARVTVAAPISSRTLVVALLIFFSVLVGVLNFVVPTHYLIAVVIIAVSAILLFMYPFIGLLVYQLIMVIQPAAIFPALEALRPERVMAIFLIISLIINIKLRHEKLIVLEHKLVYFMIFFILAMVVSIPTSYWPTQSIEHLIDFLKTFAYVLLIINIVKTPLRLKIFLWEYLLLMGYMAVSSAIA